MSAGDITALQLLGPSTGGIRVHVAALAGGLERRGLAAPVLGPAGVLGDLGNQAGDVRVPAGVSPLSLLAARHDLRPWRSGADIVHAHGLKAAWVALGGRPRRPLVMTVHNVVLDEAAGRSADFQRRLERHVLGKADRVIAPTAAIVDRIIGTVASDRLRVVAPTFPTAHPGDARATVREAWGVDDDTPVVICVARLHPQKDLETLLGAWVSVVSDHPTARLGIVGEGPSRADLEGLATKLGIERSVHFLGFRPHAVDEIAAADAMVLTSLWEAIPIVLVEAMQLGVPVVSTDVGLASDLLARADETGRTGGSVVPIGDVGGVARGLSALLEDPAEARSRGEVGRAVALELFDPDTLVGAVADVYEEVV